MDTPHLINHLDNHLVELGELKGKPFGIWELTDEQLNFDVQLRYYWAYGSVEYGFVPSVSEAMELIQWVSEVRSYTPQQAYSLPVWMEETGHNITNFLETINVYVGTQVSEQTQVVIKSHGKGYGDKVRIRSIWFNGESIALWLTSGGEDDFSEEVFITHEEGYYQMLGYLQRFTPQYYPVVGLSDACLRNVGDYYLQEVMEEP